MEAKIQIILCHLFNDLFDNNFYLDERGGRDDGAPQREMKVHEGDGGAEGMGVDGLIESNWDQVTESFDDMGLNQQLLRGIYGYGFEKPSGKLFLRLRLYSLTHHIFHNKPTSSYHIRNE